MKRPHEYLPTKHPIEEEFKDEPDFFYNNIVKPLSVDVLRMASNGIPIDLNKVEDLEQVLDSMLEDVNNRIQSSPIIQEFKKVEYPRKFKEYQRLMEEKKRTYEYYEKTFDPKNMVHRTYVFNAYLKSIGKLDEYHMEKWTVRDIKTFQQIQDSTFIQQILDKTLSIVDPIVQEGMYNLAVDKANIYNKSYDDKVKDVTFDDLVHDFNAGSAPQKTRLFELIGLESTKLSKDTGLPSYDKSVIEEFLELVESMIED